MPDARVRSEALSLRRTNRSPVASGNGPSVRPRIPCHRRPGTWQYPRGEHGEANAVHYKPDTEKKERPFLPFRLAIPSPNR